MRMNGFERKLPQRETLQSIALERHYTVPEVAELWGMSEKSVRRLFAEESGVLRWGTPRNSQEARVLQPTHSRERADSSTPASGQLTAPDDSLSPVRLVPTFPASEPSLPKPCEHSQLIVPA